MLLIWSKGTLFGCEKHFLAINLKIEPVASKFTNVPHSSLHSVHRIQPGWCMGRCANTPCIQHWPPHDAWRYWTIETHAIPTSKSSNTLGILHSSCTPSFITHRAFETVHSNDTTNGIEWSSGIAAHIHWYNGRTGDSFPNNDWGRIHIQSWFDPKTGQCNNQLDQEYRNGPFGCEWGKFDAFFLNSKIDQVTDRV